MQLSSAADEDEVALQHTVARYAMSFVIGLLGRRLLAGLGYTMALPFRLARLLHKDETVVKSTLQELSVWWDAWCDAEDSQNDVVGVADALHDCIWASMQWPRRLMVGLSEVYFAKVPDWIAQELLDGFGGFSSTKCVEDVFGVLRSLEAKSPSGAFDRRSRWVGALESKVLVDCERPPVVPSPAVQKAAKVQRVPADMFEAEGGTSSLTDDDLATLTAKQISWRSPSADNFARTPLIWASLLHGHEKGFACLSNGWVGLLAEKGCVLQAKLSDGSLVGGLVVFVSSSGLLLWRLQRVKHISRQRVWQLCNNRAETNWKYHFLDDFVDCHVAMTFGIPPKELHNLLPDARRAGASLTFGLQAETAQEPLLEFATKRGFPNLNMTHLRMLARKLCIKVDRSAMEVDLLKLLATEILGTEADITAILAARGSASKPDMPTALDPESLDLVRDCYDVDDDPELKMAAEKAKADALARRAATKAKTATGKPTSSSASGAAASSSDAQVREANKRTHLPGGAGDEWSVPQVRALLPEVVGLRVSRETKFHRRWRMSYPCSDDPRSYNKCWGGVFSETQVVHDGVRFIWRVHARETGNDDCPWLEDIGR